MYTIQQLYSDFCSFTCSHLLHGCVCVCISFYISLPCVKFMSSLPQSRNKFHHHKDPPFGPFIIKSPSSLFPSCITNLTTTDLFSISTIFSFQECYVTQIIQHVNFVAVFRSAKIPVDSPK